MVTFILTLSIFLQFAAAIIAFRLIPITGRRLAWSLVASALAFMALRRCIPLKHLLSGDTMIKLDFNAELIALVTSVLMVVGISRIAPIFTERKQAEESLQQARNELEQRVVARTEELWKANEELKAEITERKRAEESLHASEGKYHLIADNSNDWIYLINPNGTFQYVSPSCKRLTGYPSEEFINNPNLFLNIIHPEDKELVKSHLEEVREEIKPHNLEFRIITKGGELCWIRHSCLPVYNDQGQYIGRSGTNREITKRKAAEEFLKSSEERLRYLSSELLGAQERERREIAKELHDSIGSSLAAIKYKVENILATEQQNTALFTLLNPLVTWIQNAIKEVRRICQNLRPAGLDDLGLMATMSWFCREFEGTYPISVQKQIAIEEDDVQAPLKIVIFRIMQEAMNNSAKYSRSDLINLRLIKKEGAIELDIEDNGQGFDLDEVASRMGSRKGLGLISMKERTEFSGGTFSLRSTVGTGTSIKAIWPV